MLVEHNTNTHLTIQRLPFVFYDCYLVVSLMSNAATVVQVRDCAVIGIEECSRQCIFGVRGERKVGAIFVNGVNDGLYYQVPHSMFMLNTRGELHSIFLGCSLGFCSIYSIITRRSLTD
jgi:hypothetical protein